MNNTAITVDCTNTIEVSRYAPKMVSLKQAAEYTGLSEIFLRKSYLSGDIVGIRCGFGSSKNGKILLNLYKLISYLNTHTETAEQDKPYTQGQIRPVKL